MSDCLPDSTAPFDFDDADALYATPHGAVRHLPGDADDLVADDEAFALDFASLPLTLSRGAFARLRAVACDLAAKAARCPEGCRWQLRAPEATGRSVVVLGTADLLRLADLLDGAAAMYELRSMLEALDVAR
jgi:hypothetical protein